MQSQRNLILHSLDCRSEEEKHKHREFARSISQRNIRELKINITAKTKIKYTPSDIVELDLGEGWNCCITDNQVISKQTILALHGAPGNHTEWAGLQTQMKGYCRWINFIIPGFDGKDQRRGSYNGSVQHMTIMILKVLKQLKIGKVIICAHSFSTTYAPTLLHGYPDIFEGYVNVTGMHDYWNTGFFTVYQAVAVEYRYYEEIAQREKPWQDDKKRPILYERFKTLAQERSFGDQPFTTLTLYQFFAFLKLTNVSPQKMDQIFQQHKALKLPKVLLYGQNDQYYPNQTIEATIYNLLQGQSSQMNTPYFSKLFKASKLSLQNKLKQQFGVQINGEKIQSYLCFHFAQTGHTIHRRRPKQLSQIIRIYLCSLQILHKQAIVFGSSL